MSYRERGIPLLLPVHRRLLLHVIPHHCPAIVVVPPPSQTVLARHRCIARGRRLRRRPHLHLPTGVLRLRALPPHDPLHRREVADVAVAIAVRIAILRKRSPAVAAVIGGEEEPGPCALVRGTDVPAARTMTPSQ